MIASPGTFLRVGLVLLVALVLQISGLSQITVLGGSVNLMPLVVGALAFLGGSVPGAAAGFAAGLLLDLSLGGTLGASSLVLTAVGYAAGRYRELRDPANGLAPLPFAAATTAAFGVGIAAVSFMLGIEASVSVLVLRELVVTIVLNTLLALPVYWLLRRILRGALLADPFVRGRRREQTRPAGPIGLRGLEV